MSDLAAGIPLLQRLDTWCQANSFGAVKLGQVLDEGANFGRVTASVISHTGFGDSTNEAINSLADGLVEDGWPDDRTELEIERASGMLSSHPDGEDT